MHSGRGPGPSARIGADPDTTSNITTRKIQIKISFISNPLPAPHDLLCVSLTIGGAGQLGRRIPHGLECLQQVGAANLTQGGNTRYWKEMQLVEMQQAQECNPELRHQSDSAKAPPHSDQMNDAFQPLSLILQVVLKHVLVL